MCKYIRILKHQDKTPTSKWKIIQVVNNKGELNFYKLCLTEKCYSINPLGNPSALWKCSILATVIFTNYSGKCLDGNLCCFFKLHHQSFHSDETLLNIVYLTSKSHHNKNKIYIKDKYSNIKSAECEPLLGCIIN